MPEAKHGGSAHTNPSPTLLAFKPRQVLLAEHNTKAMAMKQHCSSKTLALNPEQKALLLHSVLGYLERNGFSRTLKRLLSEAQIENDNWKCSVYLEDMYGNYLETCTRADTKLDNYKEQELLIDGNTKKDRDSNCSASEQTIGGKKKKKSDETDGKAAVIQSGTPDKFAESAMNSQEILANTDTNVELKEKKKSKKVSDSSCQTEDVSAQALKVPTADTVCELQTDESTKKQKDKKKKKSQLISESLDGNAEQVQLDSVSAVSEEKCKKLKTSLGNRKIDSEVEHNCKDKKKKNNKSTESLVENIEQCKSALENMHSITSKEKKVESKDKKRKKDGKKDDSVSETLPGGVAEVANKVYTIKRELEKESFETSEDAIGKEKKSSKKRKRLASDENEGRPVEELESEESKRRKTERLEQTKSYVQLTEMEVNEDVGKENKVGNGHVGQNEIQTTSIKQLEVHANGNLEKNGQKSAAHKTRRNEHNGSAEPKTVNAFQRVKLDEVEFVDERLQDNSYWAKDGAEVGYGAKAQEILGQVRGRDFRHEKTKKKRGSYRGGQIDLHSHSVKFNYSDED